MTKIQKEKWGKKDIVTARNSKGKLLSWKELKGKFNFDEAKFLFKKNKSFTKDVIISRNFTNVVEIKDFSKKAQPPNQKFQLIYEGRLRNGQKVFARSKSIGSFKEKSKSVEQSFHKLTAEKFGQGYDEGEGKKLINRFANIRRGIVYYRKIGV